MKRLAVIAAVTASLLPLAPATAGPETVPIATTAGFSFAPPRIVVPQGTTLTLVQLDPIARHDLVSRAIVKRRPLFSTSRSLAFGETMLVKGVEKLKPATYHFVCTLHDGMVGQLIVH